MSKRAAAVARTRQRIVDATRELHGEQGIAATSWDDIAARAGVGVGTVYRHFPSLDELIPACGEITMQLLALPDASTVPALFEDATSRPSASSGSCARRSRSTSAAPRSCARSAARRTSTPRRPDRDELEAALRALVDTALEPLDANQQDRAVARAMVDLNTWEALRDQGVGPAESVAVIADMLIKRL